jgi:hypothetical protein
MIAEALRITEMNVDVFWEAEIYRLKGELLLSQSRVQSLASRVQNPHSAIHVPQSTIGN